MTYIQVTLSFTSYHPGAIILLICVSRAVLPLLTITRIRAIGKDEGTIQKCMGEYVEHFNLAKANQYPKVDILDLAYRLMMNLLTGYSPGRHKIRDIQR